MKYAKYTHVLNLLASIPTPTGCFFKNAAMTKEEAVACWDHLFIYIHEHFTDPRVLYPAGVGVHLEAGEIDRYYKECRELLSYTPVEQFMEKFERIPPVYTEIIFPVAVGMFLLRFKMIPLNHRDAKTFKEFHERYGRFILN